MMEGFVIRVYPKTWYCGTGCDGRDLMVTEEIERASVFQNPSHLDLSKIEIVIRKLRKKHPQRTFEIEVAPENSKGVVIGENYWIV